MPTKTGTIWAQWMSSHWVRNTVQTVSVSPKNRDITADAAIAMLMATRREHWGEAGISQIVSNGINETFNPPVPRIQRDNVTQITFRVAATDDSRVWARFAIFYWE